MSDIAHPDTSILDSAAKYFRVMLNAGVSLQELLVPVQNRTARANYVAFVKAGYPKLSGAEQASVAPAPKPSLLQPVTTVDVVGIDEFIARDKFREGETVDGVKIYWIGQNFKTNFLGLVEKGIAPATLSIQKLKKNSVDTPIMGELGEAAKSHLAQFWELLKKQGQGQKGALLVNGYANIAYIDDENGTRWAFNALWDSGNGWNVAADSFAYPFEWSADFRVVSC